MVLALGLAACGDSATSVGGSPEPAPSSVPPPAPTEAPAPVPTPAPQAPNSARLTHDFPPFDLEPGEEVASLCVQWTLNNEESLYVSEVTLSNTGGYHHSNWFVVPEETFEGPDGYWRCRDRGFGELDAAIAGTVLFAQSTQSQIETQTFADGAVIKIPPRHKVVTAPHMLNVTNRAMIAHLRLTLGMVHPREVEVLLKPFRLTYYALDIPAGSEARYTAECDLDSLYQQIAGRPMDMKVYWLLPHYHYLGNYFRAEIIGGPNDGELLHGIDRFDAEANGKAFDSPVDFTGATGIRMTCGFRNPTDEEVGWGIGNQEMCVMLGLADTAVMMDAWVDDDTNTDDGVADGIFRRSGPCEGLAVPPNAAQVLPTAEEVAGDLYVPEPAAGEADLPPALTCLDIGPDVEAEAPVTFESIRGTVLPSCNFSACHDALSPAAGLDLETDPYDALLSGVAVGSTTGLPLVVPGDPSGSWLYRLISQCEPVNEVGNAVTSMPRNSPTLLDPPVVAKVRAWIEAGALDD